ncbi:MAG: RnfABCDGE type electron transport complex subunit D [Gemmatimonadota bacterium]
MPDAGAVRAPRHARPDALLRFLRSPKGQLTLVLLVLLAAASIGTGLAPVVPGVLAACAAGVLLDLPILRVREKRWVFPSGALLTGMIVAMVLSPQEPWYVAAVTTALGVGSKYVLRSASANTFNPAALALVASFYLFDSGQSWWGALPELPPATIVLLVAAGLYIADRVSKTPAVLAFLGSYFLLFTLVAYVGDPARAAELFRAPDVHAALYFAFFMVSDPPTSPPRSREQVIFGVTTGVVSFLAFELIGAAWWLPGGLLVANAWEGWRRFRVRTRRAQQRAAQTVDQRAARAASREAARRTDAPA